MVNFTGGKRGKIDRSGVKEDGASIKKPANNLAVLSPEEFLEDWEFEASEARSRVIGQSMNFEPDLSGEIVTRILAVSTPKHVEKEVLFDWYSKLEDDQVSSTLSFLNPLVADKVRMSRKRKEEMWQEMRATGTEIRFTNPPKNLIEKIWPVTGRNHMKAAAVDERVFYVGGFNFGNLEKELADFMVKFTDREVVRELLKQWERVNSRTVVDDYEVKINEEFELLVDGGNRGKSKILDRAALEIEKSKSFILGITSSLYPDGKLARELDAATRRGVRSEVICGINKIRHKWPISASHLFWLAEKFSKLSFKLHKYQIPILSNKQVGVHAKLLVVDGKVAIFGTHNLSDKGVRAGTKEWVVVSRNKDLIADLMKFYEGLRGKVTSFN
jgi:phosphatidylserine/phosphatidylglycerophosphate/cardiolipin synthase-like enzyme